MEGNTKINIKSYELSANKRDDGDKMEKILGYQLNPSSSG
jgi:hypothetical protein